MRLRKKQSLRIVSGALAVSMALSVFPTAAFAAGTPQKTEAENSAVETQVEESQDNLTTLEFDENGLPIGEGSAEEGWTYDGLTLTIYYGHILGRDITVNCAVNNYGIVQSGTFKEDVSNWGNGEIAGGDFLGRVTNSGGGKITGGNFKSYHSINNYGFIEGGEFSGTVWNYGSIEGGKFAYAYLQTGSKTDNAVIGRAYIYDGSTITNSVLGLNSSSPITPKGDNVHVLTISTDATVNDIIEVGTWDTDSHKIYVVGDQDITVKYEGDAEYFVSWKAEPNIEIQKVDNVTGTFKMSGENITLTAVEKEIPLTFDAKGIPEGHGNKTSGWMYQDDMLIFYPGYVFDDAEQIVNCHVYNAGTIKSGTFAEGVMNAIPNEDESGYITGTITGGVFSELSTTDGVMPEGVHTLLAIGCTINDVIPTGTAFIAGDNQKVKVTRNADDSDFESWAAIDGITIDDPNATTIEFTMPTKDVVLRAVYKDNALEFDANGMPTHNGGKNWESLRLNGVTYGVILYDGAVLDTNDTIKISVLAGPGSTIRNGVFELPNDSMLLSYGTIENGTFKCTVINLGVLQNGTFDGVLVNAGTILDGTFNKAVNNVKINVDSMPNIGSMGIVMDNTITDFPGLISGGVFNGEVGNFGIIDGGQFKEIVTSVPLAEYAGDELKQQGITFTSTTEISNGIFEAEVRNAANITGGEFKEKVTNVGIIENGAFRNTVFNTTMSNQEMSLGDSAVAVMSLFGSDADLAIEVQNDVKTAKVYTGSITGGVFKGKVNNTDGAITGGVFKNAPQNGNVENLHTLTVTGADISTSKPNYENGSQFTWASVHEKAYVAGKQEVRIFGVDGTHSWKSDDVDLSEASLANDGGVIAFAMPGDKDVTLTASTEKPEAKTYAVTVENGKATVEGNAIEKAKAGDVVTITANAAAEGKEFAGWKIVAGGVMLDDASKPTTTFTMGEEAVTVEATYKDKPTTKPTEPTKPSEDTTITVDKDTKLDEDKTYDKDVKNDGTISKGEFTGEVTNNGTIENGTFTDTVTNNGIIKNGKFSGEVKGTGKIEGGTFQQVTEASEISGGVFGAQSDMSNAKVVPSTLKIESSVAGGSLINDVIGNGAAQAQALFAENDIATQAADSAEMVAYVVGNQTLTVKYTGTDKNFDKWDTTGLDGAKLSEDGKTITFTMKSGAGDVTLKSVQKKTDTKPTEPAKKDDDGMGALIVGGVIVAGGIATGVIVYNVAMDYIKSALPEGTAIPETREQLAAALWESAGKPEVAVEEGVVLTDTEKAMRWATENKLVSADGADSVSKFDVLVAVYKAKKL